ncbi:T9SS type A sorting domain-containing protein [Polaribacter dokdonensis]|uniref:Secretion system C-terminal sorting domain-containing protein n=1 Tax=Polaribacter dokdonensis DSW-5 TaxID=1300348 RepID=A0A0M9CI09_9FLAO|nr:T9SS type A sorting domain-containing protein [Polaribacter dokdonensis]KOY52856.1 hypothetical protein I602_2416 [Polaribacter dokdonensis DSW-5]
MQTGVLFDIGLSLETASSPQKDALYLADGPWGLDYLDNQATVSDFTISTSDRVYDESNFDVDRNVSLSGEVKGNINLFRHLLPGDQSVLAADYNFVNAEIANNQAIEIVLMQEDDRTWENRLRYTLPANNTKRAVSIDFDMFKDASGNSATITNVKTLVFSVIGDFSTYKSFEMSVDNLALSAAGNVLSAEDFAIEDENTLVNYPNPFATNTTIVLPNTSEFVNIKVFDLLGRTVDVKKIATTGSSTRVNYTAPKVNSGIYKFVIEDDAKRVHKGTFVIKQ